jgi:hypothetical protein
MNVSIEANRVTVGYVVMHQFRMMMRICNEES